MSNVEIKAVATCDMVGSRNYNYEDPIRLNQLLMDNYRECCRILPQAGGNLLSFSFIQGDEFSNFTSIGMNLSQS